MTKIRSEPRPDQVGSYHITSDHINIIYVYIYIYIYGVVSRVNGPPPWYGGGVGTRIRYTHCISTLCRLSTLPQYYKPPPHHRGGGNLYTTTIPQTTPTPQGGGILYYHPPWGGRGGGPANTAPYMHSRLIFFLSICYAMYNIL